MVKKASSSLFIKESKISEDKSVTENIPE